jgi:Zn-dependent peptidase ImmA (M78 family)
LTEIMFEAPPRSGEDIENLADAIRHAVGLENAPYFPVVEFLEFGLAEVVDGMFYDVQSADLLGGREGAVDPVKRALYIREDVYAAVTNHDRRARFTVAHEIGHAVMHVGTLNRVLPRQQVIPPFCQPEWQANRFAAALLMPRHLAAMFGSVTEISVKFGVSVPAARLRGKTLGLSTNG